MPGRYLVGWVQLALWGMVERVDQHLPSVGLRVVIRGYLEFQHTVIVIVVRVLGRLVLLVLPHEHEPIGSVPLIKLRMVYF
jgi:hypothetical protein